MVLNLKISKITMFWAIYIIISASFIRQVSIFLSQNLGRTGLNIMLGSLFLLGGAVAFFYLYRSRPTIWRIFPFLGVLAIGFFYASQIEIMEERLHLINFGLLGWLTIKDMGKLRKGLWELGLSLLFCLLVAVIDETFQWWLPYREGDIRDVLFAGIGSMWGMSLFLISFNFGSLNMRLSMVLFLVITLIVLSTRNVSTDSIPNFCQVHSWLYRGGQPTQMGLTKLHQMGIKTIINLEYDFWEFFQEGQGEVKREQEWVAKANMKFEHIRMHPILAPKPEEIDRVLTLIRDQNNWPIYIHCEQGVNRTGIIIGAYRVKFEGWIPQQAYKEMVRLGFHRYRFWWKRAFFRYVTKDEQLILERVMEKEKSIKLL